MEIILENEHAWCMGCMFFERKTTRIKFASQVFFLTKLTFLQFYGNFMIFSYSTEEFLDQIECIMGFLMHPSYEC
jgi:hypothetical protein